MQELIKVTTNANGSQVVSARNLYGFLEVQTPFRLWVDRMFEYGFEENKDYTPYFFVHPQNKQQTIDYALTLDTAKEIAMLQRSEKGKRARQYFIECERQLKSVMIPQTYAEALRALADKTEMEERLIAENKKMQHKSEYVDKVLASVSLITTTTIAKELGMSARVLNQKLSEHGIQYRHQNHWVLYSKYQDKGLAETKTHQWFDDLGNSRTSHFLVWTELGRVMIHNLFNGELSWSHPGQRKALQK